MNIDTQEKLLSQFSFLRLRTEFYWSFFRSEEKVRNKM